MIRNKDKIFGEINDRNTVISDKKLTFNKYIISKQIPSEKYRIISEAEFGNKKLIYVDKNNQLTSLNYNLPNRYVGVDDTGKLVLFKMKELILEPEAPEGRQLLTEVYGSNVPNNELNEKVYVIVDPGWYEIEISGAGGGGGGGVRYGTYDRLLEGSKGGYGGYYKQIIRVTTPNTVVAMYPGNVGGGAEGYKLYRKGKSVIFDGQTKGGNGGRNFIFAGYVDIKGNKGEDVQRGIDFIESNWASRFKSDGGVGIHGSINGGSSIIVSENFGAGPAAGGGGGVGTFGGKGGDCQNLVSGGIEYQGAGGGGGAGGSFGIGGNGGRRDLREQYAGCGIGYGGGGGGAGFNSTEIYNLPINNPDQLKGSIYSGAGGGGGGASRVIINLLNIEILVGGGGGGAGGAVTLSSSTGFTTNGENGINNINNNISVLGAKGGESGISVKDDELSSLPEGEKLAINMSGKNGEPGYVRIYKCL